MLFTKNKSIDYAIFLILFTYIISYDEDENIRYGPYLFVYQSSEFWPIRFLLYKDNGNSIIGLPVYVNDYYVINNSVYFSYIRGDGVGYEMCFYDRTVFYGKINLKTSTIAFNISPQEISNLNHNFYLSSDTKLWLSEDRNRCK